MAHSQTHDLGKLYTHTMRVPRGGPVLELGISHEVEEPWRVGRCVVLRVWKLALVAGWWGSGRTYEQMAAEEIDEQDAGVSTDEIREDFRAAPTGSGGPVYDYYGF